MHRNNPIPLLIFLFLFSGLTYAQTGGFKYTSLSLSAVSLLDIEPGGTITMSFQAPSEAGLPIVNPSPNTTKWLNYTSAIEPGGITRTITASVNQTIPGVDIKLLASSAAGLGKGALGLSSGQVTLTTNPTVIISGIGGAFTGNGINNGHQLTLSLVPSNYMHLSAQSNTQVTITYTISSN